MPPTSFSYLSADGTEIAAYRWDPAGEPQAIVQITHGMGEHALRYEALASALTETNRDEVVAALIDWATRLAGAAG